MGEHVELRLTEDAVETALIHDERWEITERDTITHAVLTDSEGVVGEVHFDPPFDRGGIIPSGVQQMTITTHRPVVWMSSEQIKAIQRVMEMLAGPQEDST